MKIEVVCFHCGKINRFDIPLVAKGNEALHHCESCNFYILTVYNEEEEES